MNRRKRLTMAVLGLTMTMAYCGGQTMVSAAGVTKDAHVSMYKGDDDITIEFAPGKDTMDQYPTIQPQNGKSITLAAQSGLEAKPEAKISGAATFETTGNMTVSDSLNKLTVVKDGSLEAKSGSLTVKPAFSTGTGTIVEMFSPNLVFSNGSIDYQGDRFGLAGSTNEQGNFVMADSMTIGGEQEGANNVISLSGNKAIWAAKTMNMAGQSFSVNNNQQLYMAANHAKILAPVTINNLGADMYLAEVNDGTNYGHIVFDNRFTNHGGALLGRPILNSDNSSKIVGGPTEWSNTYLRIGSLTKNTPVVNTSNLLVGSQTRYYRYSDEGGQAYDTFDSAVITGDFDNSRDPESVDSPMVGNLKVNVLLQSTLTVVGAFQASTIHNHQTGGIELNGTVIQVGRRVAGSTPLVPSTLNNEGSLDIDSMPIKKGALAPNGLSGLVSLWGNVENTGTINIRGAKQVNFGHDENTIDTELMHHIFGNEDVHSLETVTHNKNQLSVRTHLFTDHVELGKSDPLDGESDNSSERTNFYNVTKNEGTMLVYSPHTFFGNSGGAANTKEVLINSKAITLYGEDADIKGAVNNTGDILMDGSTFVKQDGGKVNLVRKGFVLTTSGDWKGTDIQSYGGNTLGEMNTVAGLSPKEAPTYDKRTDKQGALYIISSWTEDNSAHWDAAKKSLEAIGTAAGNDTDTIRIHGNVYGYTRIIPFVVDDGKLVANRIAGSVDVTKDAFKNYHAIFAYKPVVTIGKGSVIEHPNSFYGYGTLDNGVVAQLATLPPDKDGLVYGTWMLVNPNVPKEEAKPKDVVPPKDVTPQDKGTPQNQNPSKDQGVQKDQGPVDKKDTGDKKNSGDKGSPSGDQGKVSGVQVIGRPADKTNKANQAVVLDAPIPVGAHVGRALSNSADAFIQSWQDREGINHGDTYHAVGDVGAAQGDAHLWARFIGQNNQANNGVQYSYQYKNKGIQLGYTKDGDTGIYLGYSDGELTLSDAFSPMLDVQTRTVNTMARDIGKVDTKTFAIGAYHHQMRGEHQAYWDLVGQLAFGNMDVQAVAIDPQAGQYKASAHGRDFILSSEWGKTISNPTAERRLQLQTQWVGQWTTVHHFTLGSYDMNDDSHSLTARFGLRLGWGYDKLPMKDEGNKQFDRPRSYLDVNLYHRFGGDDNGDYSAGKHDFSYAHNWYGLAYGANASVGKDSMAYGKIQYNHSLGHSHGWTEGWNLTLGLHRRF